MIQPWMLAFALAAPTSLDAAQARELDLLTTEKAALEKDLRDAKANAKAAERTLETEIERLTAELTRLEADNSTRQTSLPNQERFHAAGAQDRHMTELLAQITAWSRSHGHSLDARGPDGLQAAFTTAWTITLEHNTLHRLENVPVFNSSGLPTTTDILRIADVAAVRTDTHAPLIHTAQGWLEVEGVPRHHATSSDGERIGVVLYNPDSPPSIDAFNKPVWRSKMQAGGPLMWLLLGFAAVAAAITLERTIVITYLHRIWRQTARRMNAWRTLPQAELRRMIDEEQHWIARPLVEVLHPDRDPTSAEDRATEALLLVRERLFRRLSVLGIAAGVAPLVGLLGTVTGMISTFSVVTTEGTSDPQLLAGGISEALLTTQFGLAVAIPALVGSALLNRAARRVLSSAEQTVLRHLHGWTPQASAEPESNGA